MLPDGAAPKRKRKHRRSSTRQGHKLGGGKAATPREEFSQAGHRDDPVLRV
ncbi:hypothetical protein TMPK1_19630 [Rhodospirillales bacterium TMPK1]|uniref:Uncharacterized protein n=1 Tax=Roseiterribacter gracilis TaxID=2812848 RepID=A0A8S8XER6_9PROT|nr:hypothetical protein TMPK1_19630 [Rhodospirillales bacterium TMPK1]